MIRLLLTTTLLLFTVLGPRLAAAEAPQTLTLADLVGKPERWPATVTVAANVRSKSGQSVLQGQKAPVLNVTEKGVFVQTANGGQIGLFPAQCDILQQANARWAKLTPRQRMLTTDAVLKDSSLWPETVTLAMPVQVRLPSGGTRALPAGLPARFLYYKDGEVGIVPQGVTELKWFAADTVNAVNGALERVELEPAQRPSHLAQSLRPLMKGPDGRPHTSASLEASRYFVFFWGANWCGWCHKVSPELAAFVNRHRDQLRDTTIVMLNGDQQDSEMLKYMNEKKLPWPAVRQADWKRVPYLAFTHEGSFPQLLITDRHGRIVYNGFGGGPENIRDHLAAMAKVTQGSLVNR